METGQTVRYVYVPSCAGPVRCRDPSRTRVWVLGVTVEPGLPKGRKMSRRRTRDLTRPTREEWGPSEDNPYFWRDNLNEGKSCTVVGPTGSCQRVGPTVSLIGTPVLLVTSCQEVWSERTRLVLTSVSSPPDDLPHERVYLVVVNPVSGRFLD